MFTGLSVISGRRGNLSLLFKPPRPSPRTEVTTVTTVAYKTRGKKESDSIEESSEDESDNGGGHTTGRSMVLAT